MYKILCKVVLTLQLYKTDITGLICCINFTTTSLKYSFLNNADSDECLENNGGCAQICINIPGSFVCNCTAGYVLDVNRLFCKGKPVRLYIMSNCTVINRTL